jgi:hypothetical protein
MTATAMATSGEDLSETGPRTMPTAIVSQMITNLGRDTMCQVASQA